MTVPADRRLIGGADIGALLGISPFATAADVWLRIVYGEQRESNDVMDQGLLMEPGLFALIKNTAPGEYQQHPVVKHPRFKHGVGHLDLLRTSPDRAVVDAKMIHWRARERWEHGVPDYVRTQVDWYMQCLETPLGWVGAFFGLGDFKMLPVDPLDDNTRGSILEVVERFWVDHVETGEPPPPDGSKASADILNRLFPATPRDIPLDDEGMRLVMRLSQLRSQQSALEADESSAKQALIDWFRQRGATSASSDKFLVKCTKSQRNNVSWKSVAESLSPSAQLIAEHTTPSNSTTVTLKELK